MSWVWGSATAGHITFPDYEQARAVAGRVLRAVRPRRPR
jgi:hypothetical protein